MTSPVAIVILSGGMDSATMLYHYRAQGFDVHALSFDYGQRHRRELESAATIARLAGAIRFLRLDLSCLTPIFGMDSALINTALPMPHGHYAAENMRQTVVPNRNAIMLAIAWAYGMSVGAQVVAFGAHAGDHTIYPDCRPEFVEAINQAFQRGAGDHLPEGLHIDAPFLSIDKAAICRRGADLAVPFTETWSCYEGGDIHCGVCGTCVERKEAFALAGVTDPTSYHA